VASDASEGRGELNLSDWAKYDQQRAERKLKQMCQEVQGGDMPLWFYLPLRPAAKLSGADARTLCGWTEAELARISRANAP
jgi:hypothetical protein